MLSEAAQHLASLFASLLPCSDLCLAAQAAHDIPWTQLYALLPSEVTDLKRAAHSTTVRAIKLRMEHLVANFQVPHAALHASDIGNSRSVIIAGVRSTNWSDAYIRKSSSLRLQIFAWHYLACHVDKLRKEWNICLPKLEALKSILLERLGFHLLSNAPALTSAVPLQNSKSFSRAQRVHKRNKADKQERLACDLPTYQRRAMLAAPTNASLFLALTGELEGELSDDKLWMVDFKRYSTSDTLHTLPSWNLGEQATQLYVDSKGEITAVFDPLKIRAPKRRGRSKSNFMDAGITWMKVPVAERVKLGAKRSRVEADEEDENFKLKEFPVFDVTRCAERAAMWREKLPDLTAAARAILEGKGAFPLASGDIPPFDRPNLPTCKYGEDVIDTLIAEYLITGAFEYCPPGKEPRCISPMGLVVKKTSPFWRLVIDMRQVNEYMARWPSTMSGLAANALFFNPGAVVLFFNPGAVVWTRDIKSGYLNCPIAGCDQGVHGTDAEIEEGQLPDQKIIKYRKDGLGVRRVWVGCRPETCKGQCSKTLMGVRWKGSVY